jgi:hypothetical protein|tara:strand:- start:203 stop:607 length:405 start_codon:yes stop_codon:yes gene_type:complete
VQDQNYLAKATKVFIKIRDERAKLKKEWETEDKGLERQQDVIRKALLDHCNETGAKSVKTEAGTFYRSVKSNYFVTDWGNVYSFIKETGNPELLQGRLHQGNLEQFFEDNPDTVIKGVQSNSEYSISVRKIKGA